VKRIFTSDESIIQGILCSDDKALAHLYHEYADMVSHLIITNSGSKDDAEDIFQDTIIVIYEKIKSGGFKLNSSLKTYIYAVSRNLWLYKLRQKSRDSKLEESFMVIPVDEMEVDNFYEENNNHDKMPDYIRLLGESCKKILLMFYYEKLSTKDIADKMQLAGSDYVKTQKYRCLQKLKSLYLKK
jgi:RNA polymerase sigma factor (sigma-70 family)